MDIADELLDDDAFDPKKLFDEKQYSTLIVNREGFSKKQNETADLLATLLDKKTSRQESEEIFVALKEANAQALLVEAITSVTSPAEKAVLTAACWESGLDFTAHLLFFVELACNTDFALAMEANTVVIENCEGPFDSATLQAALKLAQEHKNNHPALTDELIHTLQSRLA